MSQNRPTIRNCVWHVLNTADEETLKEMLAISKLGKEYLEIQDEKQKSEIKNTLSRGLNKAQLIEAIIQNMESAITEGLGFMDVFKGMDLYPKQLQHCIEVLTKGLEKKAEEMKDERWKSNLINVRNNYSNINLSCEMAIELEEVIVFLLFDAYLKTLPEEERDKLVKNIAKNLRRFSKVDEDNTASILRHDGLLALRQANGSNHHILFAVAISSMQKSMWEMIIKGKISLLVSWFLIRLAPGMLAPILGRMAGWVLMRFLPGILTLFFGSIINWFLIRYIQRILASFLGPIGWAIGIISLISLGAKLLNPREYDKYIPLVVYIYILRLNTKEYLKDIPE